MTTEKKREKSVLYKAFDKLCTDSDTTLSQLAKRVSRDGKSMSPQALYSKLQRGKMTYEEISELAGLLGYDFHYSFTPKKTSDGVSFPEEKE